MSRSKFRDNLRSARLAHAAQNPASSPQEQRSIRASVTVTISVSRRERPNSITPASSSYVARAIPCSPYLGASVGTSTANRLHSHMEGLEGAVWPARSTGNLSRSMVGPTDGSNLTDPCIRPSSATWVRYAGWSASKSSISISPLIWTSQSKRFLKTRCRNWCIATSVSAKSP